MIKKYRKQPVVFEAIRLDGTTTCLDELEKLIKDPCKISPSYDGDLVSIALPKSMIIADVGDYIIRDVNGDIFSCKPDIFHMTYEAVC